MPSIFISYARKQIDPAKKLAGELTAAGYTVWWDHLLNPGTEFDNHIEDQIAEAAAVIVIWSNEAAVSKWVKGEARMASELGKLIPVKVPGFDIKKLPLDFRAYHTAPLNDRSAILRAIAERLDTKSPLAARKDRKPRSSPIVKGVTFATWIAIFASVLGGSWVYTKIASYPRTGEPAINNTEPQMPKPKESVMASRPEPAPSQEAQRAPKKDMLASKPAEKLEEVTASVPNNDSTPETSVAAAEPDDAPSQLAVASKTKTATERSRVTLIAKKPVFMRIQDYRGKTLFQRVLRAGERYEVPDSRGLLLSASDQGSLAYSIDGKYRGVFGKPGQRLVNQRLSVSVLEKR